MKLEIETEEAKEKIISFMRNNYRATNKDIWYSGSRERHMMFCCPICDYHAWMYRESFQNRRKDLVTGKWYPEGRKTEYDEFSVFRNNFYRHLVKQITTNGDIEHIKMFIELMGKNYSIKKFTEWNNKSRLINTNLIEALYNLNNSNKEGRS